MFSVKSNTMIYGQARLVLDRRNSTSPGSNRKQARILPRKVSRIPQDPKTRHDSRRIRPRGTKLSRMAVARRRDTPDQTDPSRNRRNQQNQSSDPSGYLVHSS